MVVTRRPTSRPPAVGDVVGEGGQEKSSRLRGILCLLATPVIRLNWIADWPLRGRRGPRASGLCGSGCERFSGDGGGGGEFGRLGTGRRLD
ncbi:hypothetical protein GUJ93_ZPchr0003g17391 [Zizania palustris]|uniref:Uncharacterized protein n=1 Tax=Zizania palustris TaxID=103762 RepID=A0A8J5RXF2_ZIZPA|nr:hypothetical protein GUJ93_ZPchr0003g17391 [Zizania palustris]